MFKIFSEQGSWMTGADVEFKSYPRYEEPADKALWLTRSGFLHCRISSLRRPAAQKWFLHQETRHQEQRPHEESGKDAHPGGAAQKLPDTGTIAGSSRHRGGAGEKDRMRPAP